MYTTHHPVLHVLNGCKAKRLQQLTEQNLRRIENNRDADKRVSGTGPSGGIWRVFGGGFL